MDKFIIHVGELLAPIIARQLLGVNPDGSTKDLSDVVRDVVRSEITGMVHGIEAIPGGIIDHLLPAINGVPQVTVEGVQGQLSGIEQLINSMSGNIIGQLGQFKNIFPHIPGF